MNERTEPYRFMKQLGLMDYKSVDYKSIVGDNILWILDGRWTPTWKD